MASRHHDLTGNVYGRLTVLSLDKKENHTVFWLCACACGAKKVVRAGSLRNGLTRSCGCLAREINVKRLTKHGASGYSGYGSWKAMMARCTDPNDRDYPYYGGRGITVHERWRDVAEFAKDMGEKAPGQSIDRIDPDRGYEPDNCRWTDALGQGENKRNNVRLTINGESKHVAAIWREAGIKESTFYNRIQAGMTPDEAVRAPVQKKHIRVAIEGVDRSLIEWSAVTGIKYGTLLYRYQKGLRGSELIAPLRR